MTECGRLCTICIRPDLVSPRSQSWAQRLTLTSENDVGQLGLQSLQVVGIEAQDPQHTVVALLALLSGQLMELGVPVAATSSGLVVSNDPAWLSAPTQASPPPGPAGFGQVTQSRMSPRAS